MVSLLYERDYRIGVSKQQRGVSAFVPLLFVLPVLGVSVGWREYDEFPDGSSQTSSKKEKVPSFVRNYYLTSIKVCRNKDRRFHLRA